MCQGGNRSYDLWEEPENLAVALLLWCWFISTLIHPSICHPLPVLLFQLSHFFLFFCLLYLDSRVEEPSGFNREGMKMFIHLEGIRAMIKERRE